MICLLLGDVKYPGSRCHAKYLKMLCDDAVCKNIVGESRLEAMQELSHDHGSYSTHSTLPREQEVPDF